MFTELYRRKVRVFHASIYINLRDVLLIRVGEREREKGNAKRKKGEIFRLWKVIYVRTANLPCSMRLFRRGGIDAVAKARETWQNYSRNTQTLEEIRGICNSREGDEEFREFFRG